MSDKRTHYEILGVSPKATAKEIKAAFRRLMKEHHPDKFTRMRANVTDPEILELIDKQAKESAEEAKLINEAYAVLSDPSKRRQYDQALASQVPKPPDIRVSKTLLQFGRLTKEETKSLSFVITNVGGPVNKIQIDWEKEPNWAELIIRPDPNTTFPIEVEIAVDADKANPGQRQAKIIIDADGIGASVDVSLTVEVPAAPQPAPTYAPPPPRPTYTPPPPTTSTQSRTPWIVGVGIGIVLLLCWVGVNNANQQNAQATQQALKADPFLDTAAYLQAVNVLPGLVKVQNVQQKWTRTTGDYYEQVSFDLINNSDWPIAIVFAQYGYGNNWPEIGDGVYGIDSNGGSRHNMPLGKIGGDYWYGGKGDYENLLDDTIYNFKCYSPRRGLPRNVISGPSSSTAGLALSGPSSIAFPGLRPHLTGTYNCERVWIGQYPIGHLCVVVMPASPSSITDRTDGYSSHKKYPPSTPICNQ